MAEVEPSLVALHINDLLHRVVDLGGSDLHLTSGSVPLVRVNGELKRLTEYPRLFSEDIHRLLGDVVSSRQLERLEHDSELDIGYGVLGLGRFRVNVYHQRGSLGAVMRAIPGELVPLEDLGLPPGVAGLADLTEGLVVVSGPAGSGKSTTVAALLDRVNATRAAHIVTIEDPIEFLHRHQAGIVNQRGVGEDTPSFAEALHRVLRQDADVVFVSELADEVSLRLALAVAETGRLVITTVTAASSAQALTRLLEAAPVEQRASLRLQLAGVLGAVLVQQLVPRANRLGRTVVAELLLGTASVRRLVREDRADQLAAAAYAEPASGMQTMDQALAVKVAYGEVSYDVAVERCGEAEDLRRILIAMQQRAAG